MELPATGMALKEDETNSWRIWFSATTSPDGCVVAPQSGGVCFWEAVAGNCRVHLWASHRHCVRTRWATGSSYVIKIRGRRLFCSPSSTPQMNMSLFMFLLPAGNSPFSTLVAEIKLSIWAMKMPNFEKNICRDGSYIMNYEVKANIWIASCLRLGGRHEMDEGKVLFDATSALWQQFEFNVVPFNEESWYGREMNRLGQDGVLKWSGSDFRKKGGVYIELWVERLVMKQAHSSQTSLPCNASAGQETWR